jgi:hypothetical protein
MLFAKTSAGFSSTGNKLLRLLKPCSHKILFTQNDGDSGFKERKGHSRYFFLIDIHNGQKPAFFTARLYN